MSEIWASRAAVAFSSIQFAVAWIDQGGGLWLTRLDQLGAKLATTMLTQGHDGGMRVVVAPQPLTAEWGIAWTDDSPTETAQIYFQRAHEDGRVFGSPTKLTTAAGAQRYLSMTAKAGNFARVGCRMHAARQNGTAPSATDR